MTNKPETGQVNPEELAGIDNEFIKKHNEEALETARRILESKHDPMLTAESRVDNYGLNTKLGLWLDVALREAESHGQYGGFRGRQIVFRIARDMHDGRMIEEDGVDRAGFKKHRAMSVLNDLDLEKQAGVEYHRQYFDKESGGYADRDPDGLVQEEIRVAINDVREMYKKSGLN